MSDNGCEWLAQQRAANGSDGGQQGLQNGCDEGVHERSGQNVENGRTRDAPSVLPNGRYGKHGKDVRGAVEPAGSVLVELARDLFDVLHRSREVFDRVQGQSPYADDDGEEGDEEEGADEEDG